MSAVEIVVTGTSWHIHGACGAINYSDNLVYFPCSATSSSNRVGQMALYNHIT